MVKSHVDLSVSFPACFLLGLYLHFLNINLIWQFCICIYKFLKCVIPKSIWQICFNSMIIILLSYELDKLLTEIMMSVWNVFLAIAVMLFLKTLLVLFSPSPSRYRGHTRQLYMAFAWIKTHKLSRLCD